MATSSFLPVPADSDFPLHNLPWGVFSLKQGKDDSNTRRRRIGVAIGENVVDVGALASRGLLSSRGGVGNTDKTSSFSSCFVGQETLNPFLALGKESWRDARASLISLLRSSEGALRDDEELKKNAIFHVNDDVDTMHLPFSVGDFTDFYASKEHATNCGCLFRDPAKALQPNWLHLPVGYHGRSSSVVVSGTDVRRPRGQLREGAFGPSTCVDFELEVGAVLGGPSNPLGEPVELADAPDRIFGYVLLNDWSARDVQAWEMVPLGPFCGKNWATTVSPWVVSSEAVEPWRVRSVEQREPKPLSYLDEDAVVVVVDEGEGGKASASSSSSASLRSRSALDVALEVEIAPHDAPAEPSVVSRSNARHLYWSFNQMVAHHSVGGCPLEPGDLLGSGTVSAPGGGGGGLGCLLEMTKAGKEPLKLSPSGVTRTYLEDGDEVVLRGWCEAKEGIGKIGWGEARGKLLPSL